MNRRLVALVLAVTLAAPAAVLSSAVGPARAADAPEAVLAPVLDKLTPAVNGWRPTRVTAVFRGTPPGPIECKLDAGAWTPCVGGVVSTPVLANGAHTIRARMAYADVPVGPELAVPFNVDGGKPSATSTKAAKFTKSRTVTARWTAKDAQSGVAGYQLAVKRFPVGTAKPSWTYSTTPIVRTSSAISSARGTSVCWMVRARDKAGNTGAWSARRCTATLLDERGVKRSKGWAKKKSKKAFLGTYLQAKKKKVASFTLPRTTASEIAVVITTCPTCGAIDYYVNGKLIDIIDTYSPKTRYGVVKTFRTKSKGKAVNVKIVAQTYGFVPVKIEGFGLYRS